MKITVNINEPLLKKLVAIAKQKGKSLESIILEAIDEYLERELKKKVPSV